ncbi:MAG: aminotransferase class I/II-fold pyridoxal phosphate-dependent enzyme, partial [Gammaproteobacteria bacterium]|nr:aminotransferase class I/II-fold pyridoxal phosphate-dependent enzyme [Gammaproteobacteria bacterium]
NQTQEMCQQRDWLLKELHNHAKFRVIPSHGNMFLLNLHDTLIAEQVYEALKRNRIWVKNVSNSHPLLRGCLRISVGTPTENLILLESLKKIIGF